MTPYGCHPQVSPLKTSDLEPPNRRQTPAGSTCRAGVTLPTSCCLPSCGRRCATTQTFSRPCFASRTARSPGRYASVSQARAAVLRQLQLADWSFVPRHCCDDAACLVEAAVTCFASSFFIIKKKADEKLRHNTTQQSKANAYGGRCCCFATRSCFTLWSASPRASSTSLPCEPAPPQLEHGAEGCCQHQHHLSVAGSVAAAPMWRLQDCCSTMSGIFKNVTLMLLHDIVLCSGEYA